MIVSRLNALLKRQGWTLYRLRKESGVSYPTLLSLRDSKSTMFRADVLEKLCRALNCQPGDILTLSTKKPEPIIRRKKLK